MMSNPLKKPIPPVSPGMRRSKISTTALTRPEDRSHVRTVASIAARIVGLPTQSDGICMKISPGPSLGN